MKHFLATGLLTSIFFLSLAPVWADQNLESLKLVENVSHEVTYIHTFGYWTEGKRSGRMRLVMLERTVRAPLGKLYLQWIEKDEADKVRVVDSVSVEEINNVGVYILKQPKILTSKKGKEGQVLISAVNQYTDVSSELKITPGAIGRYQVSYSSGPVSEKLDDAVLEIPVALDYYLRPTF